MKGIVLAGGTGSRLFPITSGISKHLVPVYDKPLIYYPLSTLMLAGIRDILLICNQLDLTSYQRLLGDGEQFGLNIEYLIQHEPDGIAQAFLIGEEFIGNDRCCLILGDNIFHSLGLSDLLHAAVKNDGATIFGSSVVDARNYGVVEMTSNGKILSLEEKPANPKSNVAVTGLYMFDNTVVERARSLRPSPRGELEITDLNNLYLMDNKLSVVQLGRGGTWFDAGTHETLFAASNFIRAVQSNSGLNVGCLEEIAYNSGWISSDMLKARAALYAKTQYGKYLYSMVHKA